MIRIRLKGPESLEEAQSFHIVRQARTTLEQLVEMAAKDPAQMERMKSFIYEIIVGFGGSDLRWMKQSLPGKEHRIAELPKTWDGNFGNEKFWGGHHMWAQRRWGSKYRNRGERTYNFYVTLVKTLDNVNNFMKCVPAFDSMIADLAEELQTEIVYKTHNQFASLAIHNDSLKIFFYDPRHKERISSAVRSFLEGSDVRLASRTHDHGFDTERKSYGQILADEIVETEIASLINNWRGRPAGEIVEKIVTDLGKWLKEHNEAHQAERRMELAHPTLGFRRVLRPLTLSS